MNILHTIRSVDPAHGGTVAGIAALGTAMASAGDLVEIASLDSPGAPFLKGTSLPVYPLGSTNLTYGIGCRFVQWLRANRNHYDAVVIHGIWRFHSLGTWWALRNSNTPYVLFTHGMLDPWFKTQYPLKHLKKWMYWPWADYRVLRDAQAVLFTCEEERLRARSSFWLYRCNEVVVTYGTPTPNGNAGAELQEFLRHCPDVRGKKLVLFLGRLHPKKGCDLLIEAFAQVLAHRNEWHLVIAGPDQLGWREKLIGRAKQLGIGTRITWTGMISGASKWGALRAAEVFILPSHQENFGVAAVEALSVGVPLLVSDKVNIWREIQADRAGIIAADNLQGTCESLQAFVEMSEEKKEAMRRRARICFEHRFEIKKAADSLRAVLGGITQSN